MACQCYKDVVYHCFEFFEQILSALVILFAMVAAAPNDNGEVSSLLTERRGSDMDMEVAENKQKKYARRAARAQKRAMLVALLSQSQG